MKKLRIAQIGVLHEHADGIMYTLRNRLGDLFEIIAVAAENLEVQTRFQFTPCYQGLQWMKQEDIFELPGLDAVFVETEIRQLVATARQCLNHHLPVHMDKPGGEFLQSYEDLIRDFYADGLLFQTGYMLRTNPAIQFLKKAVRNGWIGDVFEIDGDMHRSDGNQAFRNWLANFKGGPIFNYGSHIIDVLVDLMGAPEEINSYFRTVENNVQQDFGVVVFTYPKAIATMRSSICSPLGIPHRRFTVRGTKGMIEIFPLEQGYDKKNGHPKFNDIPVNVHMVLAKENESYAAGVYNLKIGPMQNRFEDQLREFAQLLSERKSNPISADYEILVQKVVLAASGYIKWKVDPISG